MIGLQALYVALSYRALPPGPVLFRLAGLSAVQRGLYAAARFAEVRTLPWRVSKPSQPFDGAAAFGRTIDLRDFARDPNFQGISMIDYFLSCLGLDPRAVPGGAKRNSWLARNVVPSAPPWPPGYVLLSAHSSMALRRMPHAIAEHIARWFALRGHRVERPIRARSLNGLCGQLAGAAMVVSTDTAIVHLADAFDTPCLAFFPTHRPEWRVRDYPLCRSASLAAAGLPLAIEFARGPHDLAAARDAWFPHGRDLGWLDEALASFPRRSDRDVA